MPEPGGHFIGEHGYTGSKLLPALQVAGKGKAVSHGFWAGHLGLGLTISVGVSFNKTFSKMGSDYKKPDATTLITRGMTRSVVAPPMSNTPFAP